MPIFYRKNKKQTGCFNLTNETPGLFLSVLANIFVSKRFYLFCVLIRIQLVGVCVVYAFCNPDFLRRRLGGIHFVYHPCGYKIIVVAMDEEHGLRTASHLREGRRFLKVPSVLELANPAGRVEQREGGSPKSPFNSLLNWSHTLV